MRTQDHSRHRLRLEVRAGICSEHVSRESRCGMEGIHRGAMASRRWHAAAAVRASKIPMSTRGTQGRMLPCHIHTCAHTVRNSATHPMSRRPPLLPMSLHANGDGARVSALRMQPSRCPASVLPMFVRHYHGSTNGWFPPTPSSGAGSGWVCCHALVTPQWAGHVCPGKCQDVGAAGGKHAR